MSSIFDISGVNMGEDKKIAVITGGATGIGLATAVELMGKGWTVWVCGRRESVLMKAKDTYPDLRTMVCDVSDPEQVKHFFESISKEHGVIHALVNNAAILGHGDYKTLSVEQMQQLFSINSIGPLLCSRSALPLMSSGGKIVNVSSKAASDPFPKLEAYGMSKAALKPLTLALNRARGIEAICLELSAVDTDMLRSFLPNYKVDTFPEDIGKQIVSFLVPEGDT